MLGADYKILVPNIIVGKEELK